ncbi:MAG: hypothetical protein ACPGXL_03120 [Chitinophagales bacterium]
MSLIKQNTAWLWCLIILVCASCGTNDNSNAKAKSEKKVESNTATSQDAAYVTTKTGRKVLRAGSGITVVNPDGWTTQQMDFQLGYCQDMMGNLQEIDPLKFCECFLDRIQYYYEPIYAREAYKDQQTWNQECVNEAQL